MQVDQEPSGAVFAEDRTHRLYLWRRWNSNLPWIMLIGLNPSKADEMRNDPTVRRGIGFADKWGYGGFFMCNVYSLVTPDPKRLNTEPPLVMGVDLAMRVIRRRCTKAVACWGSLITKVSGWEDRVERVKQELAPLHCIGVTKDGHPRHPLYLPGDSELIEYK